MDIKRLNKAVEEKVKRLANFKVVKNAKVGPDAYEVVRVDRSMGEGGGSHFEVMCWVNGAGEKIKDLFSSESAAVAAATKFLKDRQRP